MPNLPHLGARRLILLGECIGLEAAAEGEERDRGFRGRKVKIVDPRWSDGEMARSHLSLRDRPLISGKLGKKTG